jgi:hypothetical protein
MELNIDEIKVDTAAMEGKNSKLSFGLIPKNSTKAKKKYFYTI